MNKFICETHKTEMKIDEEGNRKINIKYYSIGCHLPSIETPQEMEYGNCKIKEVGENA